MGKSTAARIFEQMGAATWDADAAVHKLYGPRGAATAAIKALVPEVVDHRGVRRDILKAAIAKDPDLLPQIEATVHPLVASDRCAFIEKASKSILVFDIPLLYETGAEDQFDAVAVVSTSADIQRQRVLARETMDASTFEMIKSKQMPDSEKRARADFVIDSSTLELAERDVEDIMKTIRKETADA